MKEFLERLHLKNKQRYINKMMEEEGLTDEILRKQVELNRERNHKNLSDSKEYVQ